jgi:hypothetical protein
VSEPCIDRLLYMLGFLCHSFRQPIGIHLFCDALGYIVKPDLV